VHTIADTASGGRPLRDDSGVHQSGKRAISDGAADGIETAGDRDSATHRPICRELVQPILSGDAGLGVRAED
jgi:hypothetical protein